MMWKLFLIIFPAVCFAASQHKYQTMETTDFVSRVTLDGFRHYLSINFKVTRECYKEIGPKYEEETRIYTKKMKEAVELFDQRYSYELHYVNRLHNATDHMRIIGVKLGEYQRRIDMYFNANNQKDLYDLAKKIKPILAAHYDYFISMRETIKIMPHSAYNEYNDHVSKIRDDLLIKVEKYSDQFKKCMKRKL